MNAFHIRLLATAALATVATTRADAIEAPADDAPPPPELSHDSPRELAKPTRPQFKPLRFGNTQNPQIAPPANSAKPSGFIGIVTADVPEILAEHLKLQNGLGVLVRSLMPDGPAAKAGISTNDIILRIDGVAMVSVEDLSNYILDRKPNQSVRVELIHRGEPKTLEITLDKRPQQLASARSNSLDNLDLSQIPEDIAERLRSALENDLGLASGMIPGDLKKSLQDLQDDSQGPLQPSPSQGKIEVKSGATFRIKDHTGCIEIKCDGTAKEVTLRNFEDQIVWTGPWNSEQDKAAAPPDVRKRIEAMDIQDCPKSKSGFHLQIPNSAPLILGDP